MTQSSRVVRPSFESLRIWHGARQLVSTIYKVTNVAAFAGDRALCDQMRRAAISVMANIAEGFERGSPRQFLQFLRIAKASAGELRSHLYAAEDIGLMTHDDADVLRQTAAGLSRGIAALIDKVKKTG